MLRNLRKLIAPTARATKTFWEKQEVVYSIPKGFGKFPVNEHPSSSNEKTKVDDEKVSDEKKAESKGSEDNKGNDSKEGNNDKKDKEGKEGKEGNKKEDKKKSTSGGQIPDFPPDVDKIASVATVAISAALTLLIGYEFFYGNYEHEISWQEFQTHLLAPGYVERILVSNKKIAKVVLKPGAVALLKDEKNGEKNQHDDHHQPTFGYSQISENAKNKFKNNNEKMGLSQNAEIPFYFTIGSIESFERKLEDAQKELGISSKDFIPVMYVTDVDIGKEISSWLPTLLTLGMLGIAYSAFQKSAGGGGVFKFGKSPAKMITKEMANVRFKDVAGCDEAKKEVMEFVEFLKEPKRFTDLGAKIPRGALLCGPPGTGKTLLAKATAGEANVPFFSISGSDFLEMFVGVGPSRVRDLFATAKENAPCIVFIDEIDAIGRQRGKGGFSGGNDERENTLNQLLVEMDGFDSAANVVVLAGTNRVDILDAALLRPGRFDRKIMVDKPDITGRKSIFEVHLSGLTLADEKSEVASRLAALTPGFTGADIANICNEGAITAARRKKSKIELTDFESATERVIGGLESSKLSSPELKRVIAYHEAGHAIAGWNLEHCDPLVKVTIIPRSSGALGFAQYLPKDVQLMNKNQIMDLVCKALAGRAAEQIVFGEVTTGASDDLQRVTKIVYQMIQVYGMNDKIGQLAFPKEDGGYPQERLYSESTAEIMDLEARAIVEAAYQRTLDLLNDKREQLNLVAELLIEKETITNADVTRLIGPRPFGNTKEYEEFLSAGGDNWTGKKTESGKEEAKKEGNKEKEVPIDAMLAI